MIGFTEKLQMHRYGMIEGLGSQLAIPRLLPCHPPGPYTKVIGSRTDTLDLQEFIRGFGHVDQHHHPKIKGAEHGICARNILGFKNCVFLVIKTVVEGVPKQVGAEFLNHAAAFWII
ncbi:MAG: hypothetical protein MZV64_34740 [Ignavibacteriales bacterium]|nr:hypothetical protein [Ignavibacteriales bacterium]